MGFVMMVITIPKLADMMVEIASICIQTAQQMTHIRLAMVTAITLIPTIPKLVDLMVEIATSGTQNILAASESWLYFWLAMVFAIAFLIRKNAYMMAEMASIVEIATTHQLAK